MADLRPFLLKPSDSLAEAMTRVSANGQGFGAVVDDKRSVLGTFCDRDGRLAMLKNVPDTAAVSTVMAPKLTKLVRLPGKLVVEGGKLVDVLTSERPTVDAMVMAGGRGRRLRPFTDKVPKPLLTLGTTTIVERILANLAVAGVEDAWLALNYKASLFERRIRDGKHVGLRVQYVREESPLGNAGALAMLPARGAQHVFITNADIITGLDYARLFDFHRAHGGLVTMACVSFATTLKYGVVRTKGTVLDRMEEKPELRFLCNAGMYVLDRSVLKLVPKNTFIEMPTVLERVRAKGEPVHIFPLIEDWVDAGSPEEFQEVLFRFATGEQT
ncbi:MAG TPA: sugar phosphate nucleotidyltransferase [Acidimicrobiales bacterium]|nr:sugar phosphate nucleotidyltransferase [Acidimicrobiales bacterium]